MPFKLPSLKSNSGKAEIFILIVVMVFGYMLTQGVLPKRFTLTKTTPSTGEYMPDTQQNPSNAKESLQLKTIKFKKCDSTTAVDFVVDRSSSMSERQSGSKSKMEHLKEALISFLNLMGDESLIGMQSFANESRVDFEIDKLGPRRNLFVGKINGLYPSGATGLILGVRDAKTEIIKAKSKFPNYKFSLIILSDGDWNRPTSGPESDPLPVVNEIKAMGDVRIFTIAYGYTDRKGTMKQAASSPSDFFNSPGNEQISQILNQIATRLCN